MGLASSLNTALTGLSAAETTIDVVGNNLANANTVAFKGRTDAKSKEGEPLKSALDIDLKGAPLVVAAKNTPWSRGHRIAGVSSFGFSGLSNGTYTVLESYCQILLLIKRKGGSIFVVFRLK